MLKFTLKQLIYVETAGRLGSISKASEELNISQSSITTAIDSIESELGYSLFVRTPAKGIEQTPSGKESMQLIRSFIDQANHFDSELRSVGGDATGSIRIACYATAAPSFLPVILNSFTKKYPGIAITLLEGNMQTIIEFLNVGRADLAFTYDRSVTEKSSFDPLFGAPPYALISVNDPLSYRKQVSLRDLATRPMVMLDLPMTREYFVNLFNLLGLQPDIVHSTRSSEIARALVAGNYGYCILNIRPPDYEPGKSQYVAIPISDDLPIPYFGIATQSAARQPRIINAFVEHCKELRVEGAFEPMTIQ